MRKKKSVDRVKNLHQLAKFCTFSSCLEGSCWPKQSFFAYFIVVKVKNMFYVEGFFAILAKNLADRSQILTVNLEKM